MKDFLFTIFILLSVTLIIVFIGIFSFDFNKAGQFSAVSKPKLVVGDFKNLSQENNISIPTFLNYEIENISSKGFISVYFSDGEPKIMAEKNKDETFIIASITKLVSIISFLDNFDGEFSDLVDISLNAAEERGPYTGINSGEKFQVSDLLHASLIPSSNQATVALAEKIGGEDVLVDFMNKKVEKLGLLNTFFYNTTGLDDISGEDKFNISSPKDLVELANYIVNEYPIVSEISTITNYRLENSSGVFKKELENTNTLLLSDDLSSSIIMSKTGQTPKAGENILIVSQGFKYGDYIISIFFDSEDRFSDAEFFLNLLYPNMY